MGDHMHVLLLLMLKHLFDQSKQRGLVERPTVALPKLASPAVAVKPVYTYLAASSAALLQL